MASAGIEIVVSLGVGSYVLPSVSDTSPAASLSGIPKAFSVGGVSGWCWFVLWLAYSFSFFCFSMLRWSRQLGLWSGLRGLPWRFWWAVL